MYPALAFFALLCLMVALVAPWRVLGYILFLVALGGAVGFLSTLVD